MAVLSILLTLKFLPESPRFYYGNKEFNKTREALKLMQRLNGKKNSGKKFVFDRELTSEEHNEDKTTDKA